MMMEQATITPYLIEAPPSLSYIKKLLREHFYEYR